jgi:hypothetical protein
MIRSIRIVHGRSASLKPTIATSSGNVVTSMGVSHQPRQLQPAAEAATPQLAKSYSSSRSPTSSYAPSMFPVRRYLHHVATGAAAATNSHVGGSNSSSLLSSSSLISGFHKQQWQQQQSQQQQQKRTVFIQTENTPNPESIKFVPTNLVRVFCFAVRLVYACIVFSMRKDLSVYSRIVSYLYCDMCLLSL